MSVKTALDEIKSWSVEDRLTLVDEVWNSIGDEAELTREQSEELDRRIADYESHRDDVLPWETVRDAALAQVRT